VKTKLDLKRVKSSYRRVNAAVCKDCFKVLVSLYTHHYVTCDCQMLPIAIDGGFDYQKRAGTPEKFKEINLFIKDVKK
jgi:hypothetical protein